MWYCSSQITENILILNMLLIKTINDKDSNRAANYTVYMIITFVSEQYLIRPCQLD